MADWQERVQSMIIGFVFAYMVMKLFSVISSFRAGNLRVARALNEEDSLLVATEVVELTPGEELTAAFIATDEETEADGGDEQEAHGDSSSSDSDAEDDAAPASRRREIDTADEPTVSELKSKDEDVVAKKDEEVEFKNDEGVEDLEKTEPKDAIASGEQSLKVVVSSLAFSIVATTLPHLFCHLVENAFSFLFCRLQESFVWFKIFFCLVFLAKVKCDNLS